MSEESSIRWKLQALTTEYDQHWTHFRHAIDKSYQAFNIHLVLITLLFSAISLAYSQESISLAVPLFFVIAIVALASTEGTIATLVVQRTSYVLYRKVIDVLRDRMSKLVDDILKPEVQFFYDLRVFKPGTAWFNRVNFVILTGSAVTVMCSYLIISSLPAVLPGFTIDVSTVFVLSIAVFILSLQKLYYSVIVRSNDRARSLFRKMQDYEKPPTESREIKALRRYSKYLLVSLVILTAMLTGIFFLSLFVGMFISPSLFGLMLCLSAVLLLMSCRLWRQTRKDLTC